MEEYLESLDLGINPTTLRPMGEKGWMSDIYTARADIGEVVIHRISPVDEQRRQRIHEKLMYVSRLLDTFSLVPKVIHAEEVDGYYVIVQERLPGTPLGKREVRDGRIVDEYPEGSDQILTDVEKHLRIMHGIKMQGFGFLEGTTAPYDSWFDFCRQSIRWLTMFADELTTQEFADLRRRLRRLIEENQELLERQVSRLVHGDMVNPGNILIKGGRVTGILDHEWALAGDPAWEFAFTHKFPKYAYHERASQEEIDGFERRKMIYAILWRLWGCTVHRTGPVKDILFREFRDLLCRRR